MLRQHENEVRVILKQYEAYIDGRFKISSNEEWLDIFYPATGEYVGRVPACTKEDVNEAIASAKQAYRYWKFVPSYERAEYLSKFLQLMKREEYLQRIATAITLEMGKPLSAAMAEVRYAIELGEYQAQWARRIEGEILDSDNRNEKILIHREPLGVVVVIVPWNFPIYVLIRKVIPALVCGNTVVVKPSVKSPMSALELVKCIDQSGLPKGVINVVTGLDEVVGEALTSSDEINMITFTGSTRVGKRIMEKCAQNMVRVSLELGGKAPAIVMEDADLELAAEAIKGGRLSNTGQVCNNTERLYVHRSVKKELTEKLIEKFQEVSVGDGFKNPDVTMGCLISAEAVQRVHAMVQEAVKEGAEILCGGVPLRELGKSFYPPTLLDNCRQSMKIVQEEIFGPVLPIISFDTIEEVIEMANDSKYGLTANIYTNNYKYVMELTTKLECGEVYVNRQQGEAYQGFHAGWKQSGIGGDDGKHGFEEFTQLKTVYLKY
jgi:lactaldehyde dehydrogenase/glycolaldehyde dehydrogenase